jgi:hypothetical protein
MASKLYHELATLSMQIKPTKTNTFTMFLNQRSNKRCATQNKPHNASVYFFHLFSNLKLFFLQEG